MPEEFGNSDLTPDQARRFISTLSQYMDRHAHYESETSIIEQPEEESPPKQKYGDAWRLIFGIKKGMDYLEDGRQLKSSADVDFIFEADEDEIVYDEGRWEDHYDEFGYGPYGKGLKIGRRLYFYEDREFEFTADVSEEDSSSFEFTDYSNE